MNKWQIICPVAALIIGGLVALTIVVRSQQRGIIVAASSTVAHDLITLTNSQHLVRVNPYLRDQLSRMLASPAHVAAVLPGDEPSGGGMACSRLVLTNNAGRGLLIRLRQSDRSGMFDVVGFRSLSD
jgi:hypothetical protein